MIRYSDCVFWRDHKVTLLVLIAGFGNVLMSQEEIISPKKLQKDLVSLEKIIEAHPDPYTHISKEDLETRIETIRSSLDEPHTVLEFYRIAASIVALIGDGHSGVYLPRN